MIKKVKTPLGTTLTVKQMANAADAIEHIATHNRMMLEHEPFNTSCSDILALVSLGKAHWYELSTRGGR